MVYAEQSRGRGPGQWRPPAADPAGFGATVWAVRTAWEEMTDARMKPPRGAALLRGEQQSQEIHLLSLPPKILLRNPDLGLAAAADGDWAAADETTDAAAGPGRGVIGAGAATGTDMGIAGVGALAVAAALGTSGLGSARGVALADGSGSAVGFTGVAAGNGSGTAAGVAESGFWVDLSTPTLKVGVRFFFTPGPLRTCKGEMLQTSRVW